jgi:cytochrome c oxidase subunit 2
VDAVPGIQSALHPQGPQADAIATMSWVLIGGSALVALVVLALAAYALYGPEKSRAWASGERFVIWGGIVFPVITLSALLVYGLRLEASILGDGGAPAARIAVIGHQWWWRVHYLDAKGAVDFVTANEIRIPAGKPVELTLESADVIHSFAVPNLAGKLDMIPGRVNRLTLHAHAPGVFRGQCAEYCGGPHAKMAFYVIAESPESFERWREGQRAPGPVPEDAFAQRGRALFMSNCIACHTVRGTEAKGTLGPDLTHVGSRTSLAAGILPNNAGTLASWISASQTIKPENLMPSMNLFSGEDLRALAAYLQGLK